VFDELSKIIMHAYSNY